MSVKPEHELPGEVFARRVKEERQRFGWTQQQLVDRLKGLGYPMSRPTLIRIEAGGTRANKASLQEVFALAAALSVKPTDLMAPLRDEAAMAITPNLLFSAPLVREWVRGDLVLPMMAGVDLERVSDGDLWLLIEHELTRHMSPAKAERWRDNPAWAGIVDDTFKFIRHPDKYGAGMPWPDEGDTDGSSS